MSPFYDLFTQSPITTSTTTEDYLYEDHPEIPCANFSGYNYETAAGVKMGWNGLPLHVHINDRIEGWVASSMILCGLVGVFLNIFCWRVIFKNHHLSRSVLIYLTIDCFCRFYGALAQFYKAYCVLSWECMNLDGNPFTGLILNQIISSSASGMGHSMTLIGSGICMNRFFAVYFQGLLYKKFERIVLPHAFFLWALPVGIYLSEIGTLINPKTGFVCYAGWFFTPLNFCVTISYGSGGWANFFLNGNFYNFMYTVQALTFLFDLITLWKVWKLRKTISPHSRADVRLSVMLVTNHFIAICYYLGKKLMTASELLPIFYYLVIELQPFIMHCILGYCNVK